MDDTLLIDDIEEDRAKDEIEEVGDDDDVNEDTYCGDELVTGGGMSVVVGVDGK